MLGLAWAVHVASARRERPPEVRVMAHDLSSLQSKIAGALDDDQKKKQVNDAKLRAVSQKSDYDVFCNLVAGAHLKPVKPRAAESVRAAPAALPLSG